MLQVTLQLDEETTQKLFRQALVEMLQQKNEALYAALSEILEEFALGRAIEEGENSPEASRAEIFHILEGGA
jgi:hypothetical protein